MEVESQLIRVPKHEQPIEPVSRSQIPPTGIKIDRGCVRSLPMRLKLAPQIRLWWTGGFGPLIFRSSIVITEGLSAIATTQTNLPYRILTKKANIRRIGSLVNQLMSRRGYAQAFANEEIHRVIAATVGTPLDSGFAVGKLQAGVLQVYASDSVTLQELNFQKRKILRNIQQNMPGNQIIDLRFRIQT